MNRGYRKKVYDLQVFMYINLLYMTPAVEKF